MMSVRYEVVADSYLPDLFMGEPELVARKGEVIYRFEGATYGCIDHSVGVACSRGGPKVNPFFEVPRANLKPWGGE